MPIPLRLTLLGSPQIQIGNQVIPGFATIKAQALLFYLATTASTAEGQSTVHSRETLATLLWGKMTDTQARQNLRTVLPELRRLVGDYLRIERQTIAFDSTSPHWLDVAVLHRDLGSRQLAVDTPSRQAAVDLYQGEFLQGFYVRDAPLFEAWMLEKREQIYTLVVNALNRLVGDYVQINDLVAALAANRRLLVFEPWSELTHRLQMDLLAQSGERAAALVQYENCRRILAAEFGIEPMPETTALYEQIRAGSRGQEIWRREPATSVVTSQIQGFNQGSTVASQDEQTDSESPTLIMGHNLPLQIKLYGRQAELARLQKWLTAESCQLVGIFGIGGQGKTALASTLVRGLADVDEQPNVFFRYILWQSLLNAPPLAEVLQEWVYVLSDQSVTTLPATLDQQISQLLDFLRRHRCLLVLDNLESILQSDERSGHYRPNYEAYGQLIRRLVEGKHRSCLLLTSRERPLEFSRLEEETPAVRSLTLDGLPAEAGRRLLQGRGLADEPTGLSALVQHYSGNPLALNLAAETVQEIFDGDVAAFLQTETLVFDDIRHVLDQQFARLTPLERELLCWLAIVREPIAFAALRDLLAQPPASRLVLEAIRSLQRRSLLEIFDEGFGLQNVVLEYNTDLLIEAISGELLVDKISSWQATNLVHSPQDADILSSSGLVTQSHLNRYALILARAKEYVRASQTRLLLQPVATHLQAQLGGKGAALQLQKLLGQVRTTPPAPGYAAANLLHLLLHLGADLRGVDFSRLYLRQAHLRGVSLPQTKFAETEILESVFTEPFGLVYTVKFSPDGQYVAAGTSEGDLYLWRTTNQQLALVIKAHSQAIYAVAFAQCTTANGGTELVLISASNDKTVGIWSLAASVSQRLYTRLLHEQPLRAVDVRTDGQIVISVDVSGEVFVWDINDRSRPRLQHQFSTISTRLSLVAFSADGQLIAIGKREGNVQLHQVASGELILSLTIEKGPISSLILSADGSLLITGGRSGQLCVWTLPDGQLQQVVETRPVAIDALVFSPDGKTLATTHGIGDLAIRLWSVDAQRRIHLQRTLLGHTHIMWSAAFGCLSAKNADLSAAAQRVLLVTGSSDQTVRVWESATGQALYTLRGHPRALCAIAIRPLSTMQPAKEWLLAAVGYDPLVHLWRGRGDEAETPSRALLGSSHSLFAVAISINGHLIAGAGQDQKVYLWDVASGQLLNTFQGHTDSIYCLAFHPSGEWLASGSTDGTVRLWGLTAVQEGPSQTSRVSKPVQPVTVIQTHAQIVYSIAFSPDGHSLATACSELSVRQWDLTQSSHPEMVSARRTAPKASEQDLFSVAFSPNGKTVASCSNPLIYLWGEENDQPPQILRHHTSRIFSVVFSPDGTILASGSMDCTVCLWDVTQGTLRASLKGHKETVYQVTFSPDGTAVFSSSFDGTIKVWDVESGECVNTLQVEGPYNGMNISNVRGITAAQKEGLKTLGAVEKAPATV